MASKKQLSFISLEHKITTTVASVTIAFVDHQGPHTQNSQHRFHSVPEDNSDAAINEILREVFGD
jgi:hypothetical protein